MSKIKVLIADDHPIVLMGIRDEVERNTLLEVVGEAHNSTELVETLMDLRQKNELPHIVIADYSMPGDTSYGDGMKLVEYLLRHFSSARLIIYTMVSNHLIVSSLQDLGVAAVVLKSQPLSELRRTLEQVVNRGAISPIPNRENIAEDKRGSKVEKLSAREFEVLRHFVAGMTLNQIAKMLSRSEKTISAQKVSGMRKLGARSDQDLITLCVEMGLFR
ncbi:hypothetical protein VK98_18220 [Chromobacterium sp. LK11]|uniref:response regulator n=1 Tax=Chromobacterium sp. LK11 TaxID=1628212 RepID=UPI0006532516|nr:LuxR C-terminal-related transcriptional regulator [Chromobacterium sp. LK11]KMN77780.1 hypothetical protein VK98_18220 [Chromobacterium sp. LK11]